VQHNPPAAAAESEEEEKDSTEESEGENKSTVFGTAADALHGLQIEGLIKGGMAALGLDHRMQLSMRLTADNPEFGLYETAQQEAAALNGSMTIARQQRVRDMIWYGLWKGGDTIWTIDNDAVVQAVQVCVGAHMCG
jgi:hypothetical protein